MHEQIQQDPTLNLYREWVLYDGKCPMCCQLARNMQKTLNRRGFGLTPLQTEWVQEKIKHIADPLKEMLILTTDGRIIGGADALIYMCRRIWWAYGIFLLSLLPGMRFVYGKLYVWVAKNRYCLSGACVLNESHRK